MLTPCSKLISGPLQYWAPVVNTWNLSCCLLDFGVPLWVDQSGLQVGLSQNPSYFLRHSKESNHSESACSAPTVKGNSNKKWIYAELLLFAVFNCKKKTKNVCYFTFTNTTALLPVRACVCFLILASPSWWSRGLVLLRIGLNSHHLQISHTVHSGAKTRDLTPAQK